MILLDYFRLENNISALRLLYEDRNLLPMNAMITDLENTLTEFFSQEGCFVIQAQKHLEDCKIREEKASSQHGTLLC